MNVYFEDDDNGSQRGWLPYSENYEDIDIEDIETAVDCEDAGRWLSDLIAVLEAAFENQTQSDDLKAAKATRFHLRRITSLRFQVNQRHKRLLREETAQRKTQHAEKDAEMRAEQHARRQSRQAAHKALVQQQREAKEARQAAHEASRQEENERFISTLLTLLRDEIGRDRTQQLCQIARSMVIEAMNEENHIE